MMYENIECPTCGNVTTAKAIDEPQKCRWCRRLFRVRVTRRGGKKFDWEAEASTSRLESLGSYTDRFSG